MKRGTSGTKAVPRGASYAQCDTCRQEFRCPLSALGKGSVSPGTIRVLQTRYRAGQHIINEGEPVTGLHMLCDGWATVSKSVGLEQEDRTLYVVGAGGGLDVSDNLALSQTYSDTAKALTDSVVAFVKSEELAKRLKTDQIFSGMLLQLVVTQLRTLEEQYIVHLSRDAVGRIIHVLLEFSRPYAQERSKAVTLPMKLSRSSLAEIIGTTPETMSRAISRLKRQRLVLETDCETIIPDIERLRALMRPTA